MNGGSSPFTVEGLNDEVLFCFDDTVDKVLMLDFEREADTRSMSYMEHRGFLTSPVPYFHNL